MPLSTARDTPNAEVKEDEDGRQSGWMKTALLALYLRLLPLHPLPFVAGIFISDLLPRVLKGGCHDYPMLLAMLVVWVVWYQW